MTKRKCELCNKTILTDNESIPEYLSISGWKEDAYQANIDVCKTCFVTRPKDIIKKLKKMEYS